jgi:hypothetical protein
MVVKIFILHLRTGSNLRVGLGKRLQTSFYLNLNTETSPYTFLVPLTGNGDITYQEQTELQTKFNVGFSNEWKYQFSDPSANKVGSALYAEASHIFG